MARHPKHCGSDADTSSYRRKIQRNEFPLSDSLDNKG